MTVNPNTTSNREQLATLNHEGPFGGERLVKHSIFLADAFGSNPSIDSDRVPIRWLESRGVPKQIDNFENDDSYRQSRHFLKNNRLRTLDPNDLSLGLANHLRENSLARQLQSKRDQPAIIRLLMRLKPGEANKETSRDAGRSWVNIIAPSTKFFLESVTENREEKVQVLETFGEFVAFFFGARPEVYTYQGTLLNTINHDWKNEFQLNYEHFLRGSQAVKNRATMFLQYDDVIVEGYMLNSQIQQTGVNDKTIPFTFNLLVLNRSAMNPQNILTARSRRQELTALEHALLTSLQDTVLLTKAKNTDDVQTFLLLREWLNSTQFPSAGTSVHRETTNELEGERTKPSEPGDYPAAPHDTFVARNSGTSTATGSG